MERASLPAKITMLYLPTWMSSRTCCGTRAMAAVIAWKEGGGRVRACARVYEHVFVCMCVYVFAYALCVNNCWGWRWWGLGISINKQASSYRTERPLP